MKTETVSIFSSGEGSGDAATRQLKVKADTAELDKVMSFTDGILEELGCSPKAQMQIDVAVEEIFVNIASYAYPEGGGEAVISVEGAPAGVVITFEDEGVQYDPLGKEDPDISLSAEERPVGGLGVFMIKKTMDDVSYEYKDGRNRLTIRKSF